MCKKCNLNPYFAGRVLVFTLPEVVATETGFAEIEGERGTGYIGVCVRHHHRKDRTIIDVRTKRFSFQIDEDQILAYSLKEGES